MKRPIKELEKQLTDFHRAVGATVGTTPAVRDPQLRAGLIIEEALETAAAILYAPGREKGDVVMELWNLIDRKFEKIRMTEPQNETEHLAEIIDGMGDTIYVVVGTAVALGITLDPFFDEIHRSNMAKVGGPRDADGKALKPKGWQPPQILDILNRIRPEMAKEIQNGNE